MTSTTQPAQPEALQTPLLDLLRDIPSTARLIIEHSPTHSQSIPVGRLASEAVAEIERLQASIVFAVHKLEASRIWGGSDWHYNPLHPMYYQPALDSLRDAIRRPASVPALGEPVASDDDLDLAKATVRGAGYSLVTSRFIIAFAEFIQDWKKGDFDLPKLAALDVESAFEAWQATDNIAEANRALAAPLPPAPAAVPFEFIEHAWRLTLIGATGCSRAEAEHVIAQSMESARLLASLAAPPAAQAPANTITLSDLIAQHEADPERKAALDEARAQLQRPIEIEVIEHPTQRCACQGAETLGTKIQGSDARECIECGTIVRWDLVEHKFYGFAATCIRANERIVMHTLPDTQTAALLRKALHRAHWFGQEFLKADEANYDRVHQEFVAHIEATIAALPEPLSSRATPDLDSHGRYWVENRGRIIDAITSAGFELLSNKDGFTLSRLTPRTAEQGSSCAAGATRGRQRRS